MQKEWIELKQGKQFSRLLYPNPVCFLCTRVPLSDGAATTAQRNVMILSWLTPFNNAGGFMFSISKRRFTSAVFAQNESTKFCLAVPVQGMEELVKQVGGCSGRFGSKFPADHDEPYSRTVDETQREDHARPLSKRQRKKRAQEEMRRAGVSGLRAIPLGGGIQPSTTGEAEPYLFTIEGTVAHMACHAVRVTVCADEDHYLVAAQIDLAFVRTDYWDIAHNLFRPAATTVPPYLTFFGSQTFGYVMTQDHQLGTTNGQAS
jgi:flavin reductase (DIM6/NTAB) family NADH-FMN oxidoreductase RutF